VRAAVDRVYPAHEGAAAYARLEAGEQFGKVVIDWRK
jgi:NADPH:quinone reductase-like Zn-dependent oxidoreductase